MRTSRISNESTRLANALVPRSARSKANLSAPHPSDVSNIAGIQAGPSPTPKRKRGESELASPVMRHIKEEAVSTTTSPVKHDKPKKARRQPAKKIVGHNGVMKIEPPRNWEEIYSTAKEMRALRLAPVDTMGCESLAEDHRSPRDMRFQTLVALMLSSQTKDTVTSVAMKNLQEGLEGGFTLESTLAVDPVTLNGFINKVGFHNNKTKYIKQTAEILKEKHDSDIPDTIEGLVSLPGVGPKMAYLCMSAAWGRDEGIGVDVHVHRITNLWGWHKTSTPEGTRAALESWLPRDRWHDINHLLVGFGQTWCPPVGRKCGECKLADKGLCPSAVVARTVKERVKKEIVIKGEDEKRTIQIETDIKLDVGSIKVEDLQVQEDAFIAASIGDIEDIGGRRKSRRLVGY